MTRSGRRLNRHVKLSMTSNLEGTPGFVKQMSRSGYVYSCRKMNAVYSTWSRESTTRPFIPDKTTLLCLSCLKALDHSHHRTTSAMSGGYEVDYDSDCDVYDYDDDYIYADAGAYDLADELASGAIAEAPALYYRDDELDEYDNYNFWSEIEYGNAEIYDQEMAQEENTSKSDKKKKSKASDIKDTIKKIRLRGIQDYPTVLWKSSQDAFSLRQQCPSIARRYDFRQGRARRQRVGGYVRRR
ncbi:hypothetical protein KCU65_g84, partial [Aureobasidium melanogenum]